MSSPGPKKVLFICKFISHYRVEFYEKLKEGLKQYNVEVHVIYGKSVGNDSLKKDEAEIEWGKFVPNKSFEIGKTQLIWQPYLKYLKGMDLVVVALENKLILNYYLMIGRKFSRYKLAFWDTEETCSRRQEVSPISINPFTSEGVIGGSLIQKGLNK